MVSWLESFAIGEACNVTCTGGCCFEEESNPKPANFRNLVGVGAGLCAEAEEGGRVAGWEGDKIAEEVADLEGGGPDGVLFGDTLGFVLLVDNVISFFVVDWGVSEAARVCLTKRLWGLIERRGSSEGAGDGDGELLSEEVLPDFLATVTLDSEGFFEDGSVELGRYLGNAVPVDLGLTLDALDSETVDALKLSVCDGLFSEWPKAAFKAPRVRKATGAVSTEALLPDDGTTSIDALVLELNRVAVASFGSLDFLVGFSRVPFFALSLFITSAKAFPTEERVIECLIFVGGFIGRTAPLEIVGSAVGIVCWKQLPVFSIPR